VPAERPGSSVPGARRGLCEIGESDLPARSACSEASRSKSGIGFQR
jgi:hypothetical protein